MFICKAEKSVYQRDQDIWVIIRSGYKERIADGMKEKPSWKQGLKKRLPSSVKTVVKTLLGKNKGSRLSKLPEAEACRELEEQMAAANPIVPGKTLLTEKPKGLASRAKDAFYEELLRSGRYTFHNPFLRVNPYRYAPLTALFLFVTRKKCGVRFTVMGDHGENNISGEMKAAVYHRVPVFGLYAGRENEVKLELVDENGKTFQEKVFHVKTQPLPEVLEGMVQVSKKQAVSAYSLFFVTGGGDIMPFAFDAEGAIRYYMKIYPKGYGVFLLSGGRILFPEKHVLAPGFGNPHSSQVHEMDLLGRVYQTYFLEEGVHHDACEMEPGGNLLFCSSSLKGQCEDRVVEISRQTGKVVSKLDLCEILEGSPFQGYQDGQKDGQEICKYHDRADWGHLNTVQYLPEEKAVLLCFRNLHSVVKADWETKKILWILADPRFWEGTFAEKYVLKPKGEVSFHYQSHTARFLMEKPEEFSGERLLMIFDNHWHKRRPLPYFDEAPESFVNLYRINEKEGTVKMYRQYACPKSKIRSNADVNLEKGRVFAMAGNLEPPMGEFQSMIREYDFSTGEVYNEFLIKAGFYRAWEADFDLDAMAVPLPKNSCYSVSSLLPPVLITDFEERSGGYPKELLPKESEVACKCCEDKLFVNTKDHGVQGVYLVGDERVYLKDYTNTKQEMDIFRSRVYYVVIELSGLLPGKYRICVEAQGHFYDTGKTITAVRRL